MRHRASISDDNSTPSPACAGTALDASAGAVAAPGRDADVPLADLADRLCGLLDEDGRLEGLSDDGLRDHVDTLRRLEGQVTVAMARATRTLTVRGTVKADGASSATAWLRSNTGRSAREASRMARFASSFGDLPATTAA